MRKTKTKRVVKKPPAKKRKKLPSVYSLRKKLWPIYSEYIRLKEADENGIVKCVTCSEPFPAVGSGKLHCGHFFSKRFYSTIMFEEMNTHPVCSGCNRKQSSGESYKYYLHLVERYGADKIEELYQQGLKKIPYSRETLSQKIEYYTKEVERLKKEKGL